MHIRIRLFSRNPVLFGTVAFVITLLNSCSGKVIFQSNFDANTVNQPPAATQQVGTIKLDGPAGGVLVIPSPVTTGGKWVRIARDANQTSVTGMQCNNSVFIGDGEYSFSSVLFIPEGSGVVTIQFEPFNQPPSTLTNFLHIDFTTDNRIRIDDKDATKFGSFSRNKAFMVTVTLKINAGSPSTAHIALGGDGAGGEADYTLETAFLSLAHQFGAVRLWMGFPHTGSFDATTIVVKHLK